MIDRPMNKGIRQVHFGRVIRAGVLPKTLKKRFLSSNLRDIRRIADDEVKASERLFKQTARQKSNVG